MLVHFLLKSISKAHPKETNLRQKSPSGEADIYKNKKKRNVSTFLKVDFKIKLTYLHPRLFIGIFLILFSLFYLVWNYLYASEKKKIFFNFK
jgi:hypothetical protein